jgi:predicted ATP-grasp superfamily ATP-dependent carboligase
MMQVFVYEYLSGGGAVDDRDAGTLLPQGLAMRDALVADLLASGHCDVTAATCAHAGALPAGAAETAAREGETPLDFVARLAAEHEAVWVIAPETGGCLADFERVVGAPRWLGCDSHSIATASSKGATLRHLAAHDVATPLAHAESAAAWVVKPDDGAGSVDTCVHSHLAAAQDDLASRRGRGESAWLEPWVEGQALSLSLLCELGRAELLSVNRQHIRHGDGGALRYEGVEIDVMPVLDPRRKPLRAGRARGCGDAGLARLRRHRHRLPAARRAGGHRDQSAADLRLRRPVAPARPLPGCRGAGPAATGARQCVNASWSAGTSAAPT